MGATWSSAGLVSTVGMASTAAEVLVSGVGVAWKTVTVLVVEGAAVIKELASIQVEEWVLVPFHPLSGLRLFRGALKVCVGSTVKKEVIVLVKVMSKVVVGSGFFDDSDALHTSVSFLFTTRRRVVGRAGRSRPNRVTAMVWVVSAALVSTGFDSSRLTLDAETRVVSASTLDSDGRVASESKLEDVDVGLAEAPDPSPKSR